jgi:hypothetical protein
MQVGSGAERDQRRRGRRPRRLEVTQQPEDPDYDLFERRPECQPPTPTQQPPKEDTPPFLSQLPNGGGAAGGADNHQNQNKQPEGGADDQQQGTSKSLKSRESKSHLKMSSKNQIVLL